MKVTYKGISGEFPSKIQEKLDAKFAKVSKLLEKRGEKEAHVVVTSERHSHEAEITLQFYDHQLVGIGSDGDVFTAVCHAVDKLEQAAVKARAKWREKRRSNGLDGMSEAEEKSAPGKSERRVTKAGGRVFRVNHSAERKPMTLEEALLEMEDKDPYFVYRDADKECLSVLVRRRDGNFDLIES